MGQISAGTPPLYRGNNTLTLNTILTLTLYLTLTLTLNIITILNPTLPKYLRLEGCRQIFYLQNMHDHWKLKKSIEHFYWQNFQHSNDENVIDWFI